MRTAKPSEVRELVAGTPGRLVVEFYKPAGCPNCDQMAPVLRDIEGANPDVTFVGVPCADGSEVTPGFQFRMFPGIFTFLDGNLVRAFSGAKTHRQLSLMFSNPNDAKVLAYDAREHAAFLDKELAEWGQGCGYVPPENPAPTPLEKAISVAKDAIGIARDAEERRIMGIAEMNVARATVPDIVDPSEDAQCDSCQ